MKAGKKEAIKYMLNYIVCTFVEAVLLLFKLIKEGLKERR